jgi:hypothetical protein
MSKKSWFDTGSKADEALDRELESQEERRKNATGSRLYRFWMPAGGEQYVTFVDGEMHPEGYALPFVFYEHQLKLNGSWKNWFTCPGEGCPLCENGNRPSLVAAYTVIDHNEWTDKKGNVHKDELKLFMAKPSVNKILRKMARKKGGLRGWKVELTRGTSEDPSTGKQFDFEERVELPEDIQPGDYMSLFAPKSKDELAAVHGGGGGDAPSLNVDADDETVNF